MVKILIQCCASLAEAHSIGIIHRDIKPDNVFLLNMAGSPDFVKLLDFSVAKLLEGDRMKTQAGVVFGTPQYMSPEQGRGLPLDARSDLYALGVLAFEMLTGNVPFNDDNPMTVIQMHLHAPGAADAAARSRTRCSRSCAARWRRTRRAATSRAGEMMQHCQQVFAELNAGGVVDRRRRRAAHDDRVEPAADRWASRCRAARRRGSRRAAAASAQAAAAAAAAGGLPGRRRRRPRR